MNENQKVYHYFNLTVTEEDWVAFVRTIPREVSIQKHLNELIRAEARNKQ